MSSNSSDAPGKLTVFFDGSCPMCTAEIDSYKRADNNRKLEFVDVSPEHFAGDDRLSRADAMARFHVRLPDGRQRSGARAFVEVWRRIPTWHWLARLARLPGILPILELFYLLSLRVRPKLVRAFGTDRRASNKA